MEDYRLINKDEYTPKDPDLDITMASRYYLGKGVEKDEAKAYSMFKELAEKGEPMAQHNMGCFFEKGLCNQRQDYGIALEWFKKAADQGVKESQFIVGFYYYRGQGVEPDISMAIDYFTKSAKQGFLDAQKLLGEVYYTNKSQKDIKKAIFWLTKAANQGDANAKFNLAQISLSSYGYISADDNKLISWLEPAANLGMVDAQVCLGMLFHRRRRFGEALKWLTEASKQNDKQATSFLAVYYHLGLGTEINSNKTQELINHLVAAELTSEDNTYTDKEMQDDLAKNSFKVATELGLYAECDGNNDEAIRFYNEALGIAFCHSGMESKYVDSLIRIAKVFERLGKIYIAKSLYNQAKWRSLGYGSISMYNTVAIHELGLALFKFMEKDRENSSVNYVEYAFDTLKSALDHYNERECILYGKCGSLTDERIIRDFKLYGYHK